MKTIKAVLKWLGDWSLHLTLVGLVAAATVFEEDSNKIIESLPITYGELAPIVTAAWFVLTDKVGSLKSWLEAEEQKHEPV